MISIIICSRFQSISKELKDNIENTVGVVHEIICIDNSKSQYDIFSAYNEGDKDRVRIEDGAIVTIGATTFILHAAEQE